MLLCVDIGFQLAKKREDCVLSELDAPLSDTTMAHYYSITTEGKVVNYSQLVADITSHPSIAAVLFHEYNLDMQSRARKIKAKHLHADAKGKKAFMEEGLNHVDG